MTGPVAYRCDHGCGGWASCYVGGQRFCAAHAPADFWPPGSTRRLTAEVTAPAAPPAESNSSSRPRGPAQGSLL